MRIRYPILLLLVAGLFIFVACTPPPSLRNPDFLSGITILEDAPCSAPCWQNITPGETAYTDAFGILASLPTLSNLQRNTDRQTGERTVDFAHEDGPQCCRLKASDGQIVSEIWLLLSPDVTLAQVIERYGEPIYVTGQDETANQAFVSLVYTDIPMVVYAFAEGLAEGSLSETNQIIGVVYMTPEAINQSLMTAQNLYNWSGYGRLSEIMSGEPITFVPEADN